MKKMIKHKRVTDILQIAGGLSPYSISLGTAVQSTLLVIVHSAVVIDRDSLKKYLWLAIMQRVN